MGVFFETGYTLPGADQPLTHARILHKGNRLRMQSLVASDTSDLSVDVLDNALTFERWKPFSNQVLSPSDYTTSDWTTFGVTIGSDGQTLTETVSGSHKKVMQTFTFTAAEHVLALKVKRITGPKVKILANDGTSNFSASFDLRDGTTASSNATIVDLGNDEFLCTFFFTTAAGTGHIEIFMNDESGNSTYTGDPSRITKFIEIILHESIATVDFTPFTSGEADMFCLAAHNLGTSAGRLTIEQGAGHTDIMGASITPTDNEPIMAIFEPETPTEWRLVIDRGVLPEIGIVRWGSALQFTRPIFGGQEPLALARKTVMRSNKSTTGEWVGRTKLRTALETSFDWSNIESDWVRDNWPDFQKAAEDEPFFLAWRPITYSEAGYCSITQHQTPTNIGVRKLMSLSLSVTGFLNV